MFSGCGIRIFMGIFEQGILPDKNISIVPARILPSINLMSVFPKYSGGLQSKSKVIFLGVVIFAWSVILLFEFGIASKTASLQLLLINVSIMSLNTNLPSDAHSKRTKLPLYSKLCSILVFIFYLRTLCLAITTG